jgi:hypothetical protein
MYIVVQHTFLNPSDAFSRGEKLVRNEGAPEGTTGLQFYPALDGSGATCLWESNSVAAVRSYVDDTLGDSSRNVCYEVDAANAFARQPFGIAERPVLIAK